MKKNNKQLIKISKERAIKIVQEDKRKIIHCFLGFIGADWDKKSVIDSIKKAKSISWVWNVFNHNLAIIDEKNWQYNFDIQHPKLKK